MSYDDVGADFRGEQAAINRPAFTHDLVSSWLPAVPDVHDRLSTVSGVRVADVSCGIGWSTLALGRAYPNVRIDGIDADRASILDARANLDASGLAPNNVRFVDADVADLTAYGPYDLVIILEALHDFGRALHRTRRRDRADDVLLECHHLPGGSDGRHRSAANGHGAADRCRLYAAWPPGPG